MEKWVSEVETLLREQSFSNPGHKEKLRNRLAALGTEISEEELGLVAGGVSAAQMPAFERWRDKHDA